MKRLGEKGRNEGVSSQVFRLGARGVRGKSRTYSPLPREGPGQRDTHRIGATMAASSNGQQTGKVVQVIGSTFDAEFAEGHLPEIYNACRVETEAKGQRIKLVGEVQQHLGGNRVRCVALGSTDGLARGMAVIDTGEAVTV